MPTGLEPKKILIVDDDTTVPQLLEPYLDVEGFLTIRAEGAKQALGIFNQERVDLVIVDLMMPQMSGLELIRSLRQISHVPTIVVTARADEIDRVVGLELGADDYITKPFRPREVVARVKAVLRRSNLTQPGAQAPDPGHLANMSGESVTLGALRIDRRNRTVNLDNRPVTITPREFLILEVLATNMGQTITRDQLATAIDPHGWEGYDRTIDSHVANLRKKIEVDPSDPKLIVTVYGLGYKLEYQPRG